MKNPSARRSVSLMAKLIAVQGPHEGAFYELDQRETVIGRLRTCGICLHDNTVGREHARIVLKGKDAIITDLESKGGTFVNDKKVASAALSSGDTIRIGNSTFSFSSGGGPSKKMDEMTVVAILGSEETDKAKADFTRKPAPKGSELAFLYGIADSLLREQSIEGLLRSTLEHLVTRFKPTGAFFFLLNPDTNELELSGSWCENEIPPISRTMVKHSFEKKESLLVRNADADQRFSDADSVRLYQIRSALCIPLGRFGVINLCHASKRRSFTEQDLKLASIISGLAIPALEKAHHLRTVDETVQELTNIVKGQYNIIGKSKPIRQVFDLIGRASLTDSTVLILGESGTGKELVARALHFNSERSKRPFVAVNCASLADSLIESELFGHERGAFTGAHEAKPGKFEQADGGTLFLDEISELKPELQAKLLRVLEDGIVQRVGSTKNRKVNVRLLAASNRDLKAAVEQGTFREDLLYRLEVIRIIIPPLRRRVEDIPMLADHFLEMFRNKSNRPIQQISPEALELAKFYPWPGNVRELKNVIERCVVLGKHERIEKEDLVACGLSHAPAPDGERIRTLDEVEKDHIMRVLEQCGGRKGEAAKLLGIDRKTLFRKLESFTSQ